jgi:hypothetical protein
VKIICSLIVVATLATACTGGRRHASTSTNATGSVTPSSSRSTPAVLTHAQAAAIQKALDDGSPPQVETVLAPSVRSAFAKAPTRLLPARSVVKIDTSSMKIQGLHAEVSAVVTSGANRTTWKLLLTNVGAEWLLYGTAR